MIMLKAILSTFLTIFLLISLYSNNALLKTLEQTPQIQFKQQTESRVKNGNQPEYDNNNPPNQSTIKNKQIAAYQQNIYDNNTKLTNNKGTEFYIFHGYRFRISDLLLILFTFALAVCSALLVVVGFCQYQFSIKTRRAFVYVDDISFPESQIFPPPGTPYRLIITLKNSGFTPTKFMVCNVNHDYFEKGKTITTFPNAHEMIYGLIGANAIFQIPIYIDYDKISPSSLKEGHLYIWGWIDYNDIFTRYNLRKHRHRTEFCYEVIVGRYDYGLRPYWKYNGADKECYRKPSPYVPSNSKPNEDSTY